MIKRNIAFTVDAAGTVTPGIPQYGGVKGEHNATTLQFTLDSTFIGEGDVIRLRFTGGDGTVLSSDLIEETTTTDEGVTFSYPLPRLLTIPAGQLCVRVDVTSLDENGDEVQGFCSEEAVLYFDEAAVENGTPFWTGVSEMLARTVKAKKQAVDAGTSAAENASAAAEEAQTASTAAIRAVNARVSAETYAADAKAAKADAVAAATNAGESRKGAAAQAASAQAAATAAEEAQVAAENAAGKAAVGQKGCEYLAGVATTAAEEAQAAQKAAEEALAAFNTTAVVKYKGDMTGPALSMLTSQKIGDLYHITTNGAWVFWNGTKWVSFGSNFNVSENVNPDSSIPPTSKAVYEFVGNALDQHNMENETAFSNLETDIDEIRQSLSGVLTVTHLKLSSRATFDTVLDSTDINLLMNSEAIKITNGKPFTDWTKRSFNGGTHPYVHVSVSSEVPFNICFIDTIGGATYYISACEDFYPKFGVDTEDLVKGYLPAGTYNVCFNLVSAYTYRGIYPSDGSITLDGIAYNPTSVVGKDGTSVTILNVTESDEDGGDNIVTFSDGKKLTVKNGQTGAKCSELGITVEDSNGNNFDLLCNAIAKGKVIVVDGMYALVNAVTYQIEKNVHIVGETPDCGFDISGITSPLFDVGDNCAKISIENLTVTNTSDNSNVIFRRSGYTATRMNFVRVDGCRLIGNVSPVRFYQSTDVDPMTTNIGIDTISIVNNTVKNCRASCFVFQDVSHNLLEVKGNTIRNFDNVFVYSGVTNNSKYMDEIARSKVQLVVEHNDVYCSSVNDEDGAWYHSETSSSSYYAFILGEGVRAHYHDNRVEGMKSNVDVALYDAYLSYDDVVYENNVWKNNCVFYAGALNNTLLKAKENASGDVGKRRDYNNIFIAEKDFYTTHGADPDVCTIYMASNTSPNMWDIQGNRFDIYRLACFTSSSKMASLTFKNNVVNAAVWVGSALLADIEDGEVLCEGNTVTCGDGKQFAGLRTGSYVPKKLVFRNNILENCRYPLGNGNAATLLVDGNTFIDNQDVNCRLSAYGKYGTVIGANNKIVKKNGFFAPFSGSFSTDIDYETDTTLDGVFTEGNIVMLDDITNSSVRIDFEGEVVSKGTSFKGHVFFSIIDGYIRYTSHEEKSIVQPMDSGTRVSPKVTMTYGDALPFEVKLCLGVNEQSYVAITSSAAVKLNVKTKIVSVGGCYFYIPEDAALPEEYQQLYHIESDGEQYIDTGVLASDYSDGIQYEFAGVITGTDANVAEYLFGAINDGKRSGNVSIVNDRYWLSMSVGGSSASLLLAPYTVGEPFELFAFASALNPSETVIEVNGVGGTPNDETYTPVDMPAVNIYLLRVNGSSAVKNAKAQISKFAMYAADGTAIRNFVPCYRVADDVVGLYDTIGGMFYENGGTGAFTKGESI